MPPSLLGSPYRDCVRLAPEAARDRFAAARVARLATVAADGRPHLVPITFALDGDVLYFAVDAKPKSTLALKRMANIAANPSVSALVDHYEDDWAQLWWARADGTARMAGGTEVYTALELLAGRYSVYAAEPPPGPVVAIEVSRWSGWAATAGFSSS
jgi:PPOX class probable F420-dependent enzyme